MFKKLRKSKKIGIKEEKRSSSDAKISTKAENALTKPPSSQTYLFRSDSLNNVYFYQGVPEDFKKESKKANLPPTSEDSSNNLKDQMNLEQTEEMQDQPLRQRNGPKKKRFVFISFSKIFFLIFLFVLKRKIKEEKIEINQSDKVEKGSEEVQTNGLKKEEKSPITSSLSLPCLLDDDNIKEIRKEIQTKKQKENTTQDKTDKLQKFVQRRSKVLIT